MDTFTWLPLGTIKPKYVALQRRVDMESGVEQVQQIAVNPKITWELPIEGISEDLVSLQAFWNAHALSGETFYYIDFYGVEHTVRFPDANFEPTPKLGFVGTNPFGICGFSVNVTLRKVWPTS